MKNNKLTDKEIEKLWDEFSNTPITEDGEYIDEDFHIWEKGTAVLEIWHWFDERHSKGLASGLLYFN